jgi:hypothetical protein
MFVSLLYQVRTYFQNKLCRALRARGGSKLNRTLHESPVTASLHSATPKRKNAREIKKEVGKIFSLVVQSLFRKNWTAEAGLRRQAERKNGGGKQIRRKSKKIRKKFFANTNLCQILALEN